jgi:isoleucyl-tRNA synthetase
MPFMPLPNLPAIPDFPALENKWLDNWQKTGLYQKYLDKNKSASKTFSFIDGPITANNFMGVHHGWGRTYKDLWQKFHNLMGYKQRFQNGFDCQGLWVEVEVEKELGLKSKKDIENLVPGDKYASIAKFVRLCKERVNKFSQIQTQQSQRLGYFMDWDHSYYTMSNENNYMIWHFLKVCHQKGWLYKGADSVPWCPRCQTAISQHEMLTEDYQEVSHESIILKFKIQITNNKANSCLAGRPSKSEDRQTKPKIQNEYLLVWTTTPWTIPANIAVAVDTKLDYALVKQGDEQYWLAKETVERVFQAQKAKLDYTIVKVVKGKELVGLKYQAPFDFLPAVQQAREANPATFHTVIGTDPLILPIVTSEGTGLVHTAVSAGSEDFKLGQKYGLPMIPVIDDEANYLPGLGEFTGKNAKKHPRLILDYLEKIDRAGQPAVFAVFNYLHRYPACWRCKTELVWKVTNQWYIGMDIIEKIPASATGKQNLKLKKETFRQKMIRVAKKIQWKPDYGLERELDWLENMHDWLISKPNRYWGLALPIYECTNCQTVTVIGSLEELKQKTIAGWEKFTGQTPHKPYIDDVKITCPQCQKPVNRISDVGNVWLDAGIVPFATLVDPKTKKLSYLDDQHYFQEWFPADVISESFPGQFKNWFYSLIAMSTALVNQPPFKKVLGYASCVGEDGRPMHKSWGNAIEFNEAADKAGADIMRWLYCRQDPTKNLLFGFKILDEVKRQFFLPLWNSVKYLLLYCELDHFDFLSLSISNLGDLNNLQLKSPLDC